MKEDHLSSWRLGGFQSAVLWDPHPCALLSKVLLWLSRGSSFLFWPRMHEHSHGLHVLQVFQVCELQSGRGPPHS